MGKLSAGARNALPGKAFAGPNRSFPIENKAHAVAAERMVPRAVKAGSITPAQGATIKAKAAAKAGAPMHPKMVAQQFKPKAAAPSEPKAAKASSGPKMPDGVNPNKALHRQ